MNTDNFITTTEFKNKYKEIAFSNNNLLKNELIKLLDNTKNSYYRLNFIYDYSFYRTDDKFYNRDAIIAILNDYLENGYSYIYDYSLPNNGGFEYIRFDRKKYFVEERNIDIYSKEWENIWNENFSKVFYKIQEEYYRTNNYLSSILPANIFSDRDPKGINEVTQVNFHYKLFDLKNTLSVYEKLMTLFWSDYTYNPKISSSKKKVKRYTKQLNNDYSISILIDYKYLEGELKNGYFECPAIVIELYYNKLNEYVNYRIVKYGQTEHPIISISPYRFLGRGLADRIGNGQNTEEELIKKLIIYFDAYSQLISVHLKYIEKNILDTLEYLKKHS